MNSKELYEALGKKSLDDYSKWKLLVGREDVSVILDNDCTFIEVQGEEDWFKFRDYIGNARGVRHLLDLLGINSRKV